MSVDSEQAPVRQDAAGHEAPPGGGGRLKLLIAERPVLVLLVVLVVLVGLTGLIEPRYLSLSGLRNTLLLAAPMGIMAAGQTVLMLTRGIDLSVAMVATAAAYVVGLQGDGGIAVALLLGLLTGTALGALNGLGVGVFRVHPLIMTLAMSSILLGLLSQWAQTALLGATSVDPFVRLLGAGAFLGNLLPYNTVVWAVIAVVLIVGLRSSGLGRMIYALGDNPVATRLAGVREWQVLIVVYALSGLFAALAGVLIAGQTGAVDLRLAQEFLLPSIAAAVIGGTSLFGGAGSYGGTILGALILSVLNTMMVFLNAPQALRQVVFGGIVVALAWLYAAATRDR